MMERTMSVLVFTIRRLVATQVFPTVVVHHAGSYRCILETTPLFRGLITVVQKDWSFMVVG